MPFLTGPAGERVRLAYCTNVHPGETLAAVEEALDRHAVEVRRRAGLEGRAMGVGLWLAAPVARELGGDRALARRFRDALARRGLVAFTLNAFPYGGFHASRVKTAVYRPAWAEEARARFTLDAARALAAILPEGEEEGTISTLPIGWRTETKEAELASAAARLGEVARALAALREETGKRIRVLIEPEPGCAIETTGGAVAFFARFPELAASGHVGVCFDCCHQAVMGEDPGAAIARLAAAGVAVGKVHLSSAVEGAAGDLARLREPRWLHQAVAADGRRADDLEGLDWPADLRARAHFHVPIYAERLASGLATTRAALEAGLAAALALSPAPDLEVETYTWDVLPEGERPFALAEGIAREMRFVLERLAERGVR